jgi:hypothetical protein
MSQRHVSEPSIDRVFQRVSDDTVAPLPTRIIPSSVLAVGVAVLFELWTHDLRTETEIERRFGRPGMSRAAPRWAVSRTDAPSEAVPPGITVPRTLECTMSRHRRDGVRA